MTSADNSSVFNVEIDFKIKNAEALNEAIKKTRQLAGVTEEVKKSSKSFSEESKRVSKDLGEQAQAQEKLAKAQTQVLSNTRLQIRDLRAQSREIIASVRLLKDASQDIDRFAKPLFTGGLFLVGGIFAAANKYVNDAKEATQVTREWKAAQESLNQSGTKIGAILAEQALPILKEAAQVTAKIAGVLQAHPEIAGVALKTGLLAITLGAIGKAVAGGIRLYADFKMDASLALQFEAATLQAQAARMQLEAAAVSLAKGKYGAAGGLIGPAEAGAGGLIGKTGAAAGLGTLGSGLVLAGAAAIGSVIGLGIGNAINKAIDPSAGKTTFKDLGAEFGKIIAIDAKIIGDVFGKGDQWFKATAQALGLLKEKGDAAAQSLNGIFLGGSKEIQDKVVADYTKMVSETAKITAASETKRLDIIATAEKDILAVTARAGSERQKVASDYAASLSQATSTYNQSIEKLDSDEAKARASILRGSSKTILKVEADLQKQLAELAKEHANNQVGLIADRDALGLVKEQERYDSVKTADKRNAQEQIGQERADLAERLREQSANFADQRMQRLEQYRLEVKDASEKRAAALTQIAAHAAEERKVIQEAKNKKLEELRVATAQEIKIKRDEFITAVRDLNSALTGERNLKNQYYNDMLADAKKFLDAYRASLPGAGVALKIGTAGASVANTSAGAGAGAGPASNTWSLANLFGTKDVGGYVDRGIYKMAWNGNREFVSNGISTRAAEQAIGGQMTQQNMTQAYKLLGAMRGGLNYQDNSHYDASVSPRVRRDMRNEAHRDTAALLEGLFA